ncbi:MAG: TolC family protein [Bacteroidetes bacterium]|nr:TolC family protein [Bacteroidota bacterium]MBS1539858.1 TolC family protein [Bacteroidota bacterium]
MKQFYKILCLTAIVVLPAISSRAQQGQSFTLEQCIEYAIKNSVNMQNAIIDQEIAKSKVRETVGIGLPQINANANATDNVKLPRFFSRYVVAQQFNPSLNVPGLSPNDVVAGQNFFQLTNSLMGTVSANQMIFNGSYIVGLQASNAFKELTIKSTNQTREQTIVQVIKAFYASLINRERLTLFETNIARVDSLLKNTSALNANGFAESIDVDRVQVSLNNLVTEKSKFERLQKLSIDLLKFQMNYPMDDPLEISGSIADLNIDHLLLDDYLKDWDMKSRPDYQVLEVNQKLQKLNIKNKYFSALPVLSANATLGYSKQATSFSNLFSQSKQFQETPFGTGPNKLYQFSSYGFTLNVPLFSGLQHHYQLQQEKLKLQKVDNSFRMLKSSIDLEIKQATTSFQNNIQSLEYQKKNMGLADKVAKVTKIKYQQGVGSNIEVVDAESSLKEAQLNYYNALYEALVAKTDLDKAFGKILPMYSK